jgi:2,3-bisphosphoglycerate-independent phosphoglycerate mutase
MRKAALIILDGWGIGNKTKSDAIYNAKTPTMDFMMSTYPTAQLLTHGHNVGLPEGQMGNSEVGHMNIGAGQVVWQMLEKINQDFLNGLMAKNPQFLKIIEDAKKRNKLHLIGLVSDGGVHSHIDHLIQMANLAHAAGIEHIYIHAFMDGRDTDPKSGVDFLSKLKNELKNIATIATVIGRYFAMDRDKRWERTSKAYNLMVHGKGEITSDFEKTIKSGYEAGLTDEFLEPLFCGDTQTLIMEGDTVLSFNFRTDRGRQITEVLSQIDMPEFGLKKLKLNYYTTTVYDEDFKISGTLYPKEQLQNTLGQVIAEGGYTQLRAAETEKYPHVTFFFNGGREDPFAGEHRIMANSPKVATYDLQPEMSAIELTERVIEYVEKAKPQFICLNYANPDMVGHTGIYEAIIKALETVDSCVKKLSDVLTKHGYDILIIADHGNADFVVNEDGTPNTAHSTNPVPVILTNKALQIKNGKLADVAPTLLELMGIPQPEEMTGESLINIKY